MEPFIGEIMPWPGKKVPKGWLLCDGRDYAVSAYQSLFTVIGNRYGGNNTTFNVPDLRGRTPIMGQPLRNPGQTGGSNSITLNANTVPEHAHDLPVTIELALSDITAKLRAY